MLVKAKKVYKKLPLGVKMKIRKYVLRRDNSSVQIKGKQIAKRNIDRILYTDGRLFDEVNKFSKNYISKAGKDKKFKLITTYAGYRTLPILEKTILFETFHGKSMTDNPYALFLEMLSRGMERDFNFVWVLNHNDSLDIQARRFKNVENLIFVKLGSLDYIKYLATAKYLINNTSFPPYFVRRQEQKYLNTWHGTPLKTLGKDMKGSVGQHKNLSRNFLQSTHILSPNKFTGDRLIQSHDLEGIYKGEIIEEGYPRVDLITNTNEKWYKSTVLDKVIKINKNKKIALYAPTWRGEVGEVEDVSKELLEKYDLISKNIPEEYQLLLKVHPLLYRYVKDNKILMDNIVPDELDVCEVMSVVDLLITDYSSIFIDFLVKDKPIILYQYDQKVYLRERGMYLDMNALSFPLATNDNEMIDILHNIDKLPKTYEEKQNYVYSQHGLSSSKVIDRLFDDADDINVKHVNNEKDNILVYCSNPEQYKAKFINSLINQKENVILWFSGKIDQEVEQFLALLDKEVKIFFEWDSVLFTQYEWCEYQYYMKNSSHYELEKDLTKIFQREIRRSFSEIEFKEVYYLGDLKSKHYLSLISKGLECPKYILYNSVESVLEYQNIMRSTPKMKEILKGYKHKEDKILVEKVAHNNPKILHEGISFDVISLSERKAYLLPTDILNKKNIVLIFRNNKGKQLSKIMAGFFNNLYDAEKDYIIYANPEIENELKNYPNIYFVPNNVDKELFLNLLGNEEYIVNFSNPVTDPKISILIEKKGEKSFLFNYDPNHLLSYLVDEKIISLENDEVYALQIKNFLLQQKINSQIEQNK